MSRTQEMVAFAAVASPLCIAVGVFGFWAVQRSTRLGRMGSGNEEIRRKENPRVFWTFVWMWRLIAVGWVIAAIAIALLPLALLPAE